MPKKTAWSKRFFYSAIAQGVLVFLVTVVLFIYGSLYLKPSPAMVIASGSAGTWLLVGYSLYIVMILYLGVTSFFYYQIEADAKNNTGKTYNWLSVLHLALANIGILGTTFLLMYAGYAGGAALAAGMSPASVHGQILGVYPERVIAFILVTMLGALCGGLSYITALFRRK